MKLHNVLSDLKKQTENFQELKKSDLPWEVAKKERLKQEKGSTT